MKQYLSLLTLFHVALSGAIAESRFSMVFVGDVMCHASQLRAAFQPETATYHFFSCFENLRPAIEQADIAIANLETTLGTKPFTGYPTFSSPETLAVALQKAGFDALVTANNHSCDRGYKGIKKTIEILDSLGIAHSGTYLSTSHRDTLPPLLWERGDFRIALLNYTYGTNGLKAGRGVVNLLTDTARISQDIERAKQARANIIILFYHWGHEYQRRNSTAQKRFARWSFAKGASLVIGAHPHVVQPIENIANTSTMDTPQWVAYSLGNFISNQRKRYRDGGIMLKVEWIKTESLPTVSHISYLPFWVWKSTKAGRTRFQTLLQKEIELRGLTPQEKRQARLFFSDTKSLLPNIPIWDY